MYETLKIEKNSAKILASLDEANFDAEKPEVPLTEEERIKNHLKELDRKRRQEDEKKEEDAQNAEITQFERSINMSRSDLLSQSIGRENRKSKKKGSSRSGSKEKSVQSPSRLTRNHPLN